MSKNSPDPFIIYALPRSRTAWLAHYLNYDKARPVGHDILIECGSANEFIDSYGFGMAGTVETGAVLGAGILARAIPDLRAVAVLRPLTAVKASLAAWGIIPRDGELEERESLLHALVSSGKVELINYDELEIPQVCKWLFEYCLQIPWDEDWYRACAGVNIQVDMRARVEQLVKNYVPLQALEGTARNLSQDSLHAAN